MGTHSLHLILTPIRALTNEIELEVAWLRPTHSREYPPNLLFTKAR